MDATELFMRGYLSAALSEGRHHETSDDLTSPVPMDAVYDINDIPDDIVSVMRSDCLHFIKNAGDLIESAPERAGRDFHLTKNDRFDCEDCETGFYSKSWGDAGERLAELIALYSYRRDLLFSVADGIYVIYH